MSPNSDCNVLSVRIEKIEEDVGELKDTNEKDRENNILIREAIVKLSTLLEKQDERQDKQEIRIEKQDNKLDYMHQNINEEIKQLRDDIDESTSLQIKWYQKFFEDNFGKVIKILLFIILILIGYKLAQADLTTLFKLL